MIRLSCPTGCAGFIRRPHPRRTEPVRCTNCRAWLAAAASVEDGALAQAVLLARPGEPLVVRPRARRPRWWLIAVAVVLAVALLVVGFQRHRRRRHFVLDTDAQPVRNATGEQSVCLLRLEPRP